MFVLNSSHYFNVQCRIGQLQLFFSSKCCPVLPEALAPSSPAPMRSAFIYIYNYSFFLRAGIWSGYFFRLGGSRGFSELEILSQIASFERRLWGAAPTPLILPYPFGTSTCTRIEVERDKREVRKNSYFERYSPFTLRILMYGEIDKIKLGKIYYFQIGVKFCPTTNNI